MASETNMERIRREFVSGDIWPSDIEWLVEQAERAQELETKNKTLADNHFQQKELTQARIDKFYKLNLELYRENNRLREAIKQSLEKHKWNNEESAQILEKALAGETNGQSKA